MKTLVVLTLIAGTIIFLLRQMRKREIAAFKDEDMTAFHLFAQNRKLNESSGEDSLMARAEAFAAENPELVTLRREEKQEDPAIDPLNAPDPSLYVRKTRAFDEVTRNMLRHLSVILPDSMTWMTGIRLSDFATSENGDSFRLANTQVAYLVCDAETLEVICGLQHRDAGDTGRRDIDFVKSVFRDINLPLLEFPVKNDISEAEVRDRLAPLLKARGAHTCPKCGQSMTVRKAAKGRNAGEIFWVCDRFPGCRGVLKA